MRSEDLVTLKEIAALHLRSSARPRPRAVRLDPDGQSEPDPCTRRTGGTERRARRSVPPVRRVHGSGSLCPSGSSLTALGRGRAEDRRCRAAISLSVTRSSLRIEPTVSPAEEAVDPGYRPYGCPGLERPGQPSVACCIAIPSVQADVQVSAGSQ